jgi:hypothetical protein
MDMQFATSSPRTRHSVIKGFLRLALSLSFVLVAAAQASAQYGGGGGGMAGATGTPGSPGYVAPSSGYGSGKAIGIGVGAAAGGAGVLFLALHHRGVVSGCVQPADDGLRLVDEKNRKSYVLAANALILKPGQHVELKGQKSKNESGAQTFEAKKLVKDLGTCTASASAAQTQPSGN